MSEAELIAACRLGDHRAFADLTDRYRTNAWHVCLQITGNTHDAEDALQDAITAAWQNLHRFRGESRFNTWLHRIAANAALAVVRRRKPADSLDADTDDLGIDLGGDSPRFDDQVTTSQVVHQALAQLPEDFRVAIVLAEFADLPYADIAEHQGVSVATVKTRIHRARKQLAALLRPDSGILEPRA
jgi:RNA polymerase sigma factor (sigma-70 family)